MMKKLLAFSALCALTLAFGLLAFGPQAFAGPVKTGGMEPSIVFPAGSDCYSVGEQIARENGGELANAMADTQDGQPVCRIIVLVPSEDGGRPKRREFVVPQ
jgi:hypothetical protein